MNELIEETITNRTEKALGNELVEKMRKLRFCVVGCGGTGSTFAEMLVRTGAKDIHLIDGESVKRSNLNRVFSFIDEDVGKKKVEVLKKRLTAIVPDAEISTYGVHFRNKGEFESKNLKFKSVRDCVFDSNVVFIGIDNNRGRIACEELCAKSGKTKFLSCGVNIDIENRKSRYECSWSPRTPEIVKEEEGYGDGSYVSIVSEATSVAFSMLIHHLKNPEARDFIKTCKEYSI